MEAISVKDLSFCYRSEEKPALNKLTFSIREGELVTLCGASGSGKTTLLRLLKPSVSPNGKRSGELFVFRNKTEELGHREDCKLLGYVSQSPDNQLVTDKVWHELAFGLESLGLSSADIRRRVAETAAFFGLEALFERNVCDLSGGQKQLLNLASVMAMQPKILILDEPTSQLDPVAAVEFISCIRRVNRELGVTVLITEHRLDDIISISDRVLVLDSGELIADAVPEKIGAELKKRGSEYFESLPAVMRIWHAVGGSESCPYTVATGREWLERYANSHSLCELYPEPERQPSESVLEIKKVSFCYDKNAPDVLCGLSLELHRGELVAVLGGNGAGKSTMLSVACGALKPYRGSVKTADGAVCALLPQNPRLLLNGKTVREALCEAFDGDKRSKEEKDKLLMQAVSFCRLDGLIERHPFDLSGGEQQRAALARLLLMQPDILLLDEPTKGMDAVFKSELASLLDSLCESGISVLMVSHDTEFCANYAHRCAMLFRGEITAQDSPRSFFSSNSFYTTSASRIARALISEAVTADEVIYCCTGKRVEHDQTAPPSFTFKELPAEPQKLPERRLPLWKKLTASFGALVLCFGVAVNTELIKLEALTKLPIWARLLLIAAPVALLMISLGTLSKRNISFEGSRKLRKRTIVAAGMIIAAIPLTIFIGTTYLQDQKYLFISLLILIECMLPFFLIFEGRKPQARELVVVAVLCAIAIAGRSAFAALPQVKPVIALVIISGVALGGETGFVVGAVTMLISNIYFGQGSWTPWQMFAAGIIGFAAGVLSRRGWLSKNRASLCIFGFTVTLLIYGLIMNFSSLVLTRTPINLQTVSAFIIQGLPMDLIHALSTLAILFFAAEPMLEKLDRIKIKYGFLE